MSLKNNQLTYNQIENLLLWRNQSHQGLSIAHDHVFPEMFSPAYTGDRDKQIDRLTRAGGAGVRLFTAEDARAAASSSHSPITYRKDRMLTDLLEIHQQQTGFSCAAAVCLTLLKRFENAFGSKSALPTENDVRGLLGTNSQVGTELERIIQFFQAQKIYYVLGGFSDHLSDRSEESIANAANELLEITSAAGIPLITGIKEFAGHYVVFTKLEDGIVEYLDPMSTPVRGGDKHKKLDIGSFDEKWFYDVSLYGQNAIGRQGGFVVAIPLTEAYAQRRDQFEAWKHKYGFNYCLE